MSSKKSSKNFREKVLEVVGAIPRGKVLTYGQVASLAGNARASRAVGTIMSKNWDSNIPCHRVVRSDGSIGEYNRGGNTKRARLIEEGVMLRNNRCVFS